MEVYFRVKLYNENGNKSCEPCKKSLSLIISSQIIKLMLFISITLLYGFKPMDMIFEVESNGNLI